MPIVVRKSKPYSWEIGKVELANVANVEKKAQEISLRKMDSISQDRVRIISAL